LDLSPFPAPFPAGWRQIPSDPAPTGLEGLGNGIHQFAIDEYRNSGLDVHEFKKTDVDPNDGTGHVLKEIVSAINDRAVDHVVLIGYSRGGGKIFPLSMALMFDKADGTITRPFTVPMTAYIDAIDPNFLLGLQVDQMSETRRPKLTDFHLNQYQLNSPIHGGPISVPDPGDVDLDVSSLPDPDLTIPIPWTIIHPRMSNSPAVQQAIRARLRALVSP
jgi:hypothetical protein